MAKPSIHNLKKHSQAISACRECNLTKGYFPQLRPPGPGYHLGGVVFVQINPGHIGSMTEEQIDKRYKSEYGRKTARWKASDTRKLMRLQKAFVQDPTTAAYNNMRDAFMESMANVWGWPPGKYGKTIEAHSVTLQDIAVLNLAQCPVPNDSYRQKQLWICWNKWGYRQLKILQPSLLVAQGKQVFEFLMNQELPAGVRIIEGLHHAERRSLKTKNEVLDKVRNR